MLITKHCYVTIVIGGMRMDDLISKKELLKLTQISYGQLYRWKRKNIIPEQWFIKKSSYTGQETFFPKEKVLARIQRIKELKDDLSLDDIATIFSPKKTNIKLTFEDCQKQNLLKPETIEIYQSMFSRESQFNFQDFLGMRTFEQLLQSGMISIEEGKHLLTFLRETSLPPENCKLVMLRKMGVAIWMLIPTIESLRIEQNAKRVIELDVQELIEKIHVEKV